MPWVEKLSDPDELRRCIRDLVALSTLPAIWETYDSRQIADSVTAALFSVLHTDAARLNTAGQLAAALAHELNQPLTAATNSVNAARRLLGRNGHGIDDKVGQIMSETAEQTLRAGQIIRRLRDFLARGETGMGLGLSICRSIIEAHGGQLRSGSDPDGGTIFRFTVAAVPADGEIHAG
jgi:signal transduction histidine kinase